MRPIPRSKAEELQCRLTPFLQQEEYEGLAAEIRRELRAAKQDPDMTTRLRLLLGQAYHWAGQPAKERAQYRKVLEHDSGSTEAMLAMGHSFHPTGRLAKAEQWFRSAYSTSKQRQDCAGQLEALDALAYNEDLRGNSSALLATLEQMIRVVTSAPRMHSVHAMIGEWLIVQGKGEIALPYLECLIQHTLRLGYPRPLQLLALRPWIGIRRQQGRSYEEISEEIKKFRLMAPDDETAANFDIATEWAFQHCRHVYEMIVRDLENEVQR